MNSSNNDVKDNTDVDNTSQIRQTNTPPTTSNPSQSSSPSCPTLLVIDDTSNSEDSTKTNTTNNIPTKPMPSTTAQISHVQVSTAISPSTHLDVVNGSVEQQRRRNSSIAKLLGGHPLHNQQYEEIHQQILEDQSAQSVTNNNDNGIDSGIQRTRSSITRTLLMNAERTNSMTKRPPMTAATNSPSYSKDFDYLIRRELDKLDTEHPPSRIQRHDSASKTFPNLNSPSNTNAQSPTHLQLKRKRPISKTRLITQNKSVPNAPPFALHDPFELDSSAPNPTPPVHHPQKDFIRFDPTKLPRPTNPQQYNLPVNNNNSTPNQSLYPYPKTNMNPSVYNQFNIHKDRVPSNNCSSTCNCSHHSHSTTKLALPSPVAYISSPNNNTTTTTTTRKAKSMLIRPEPHEIPRQRSYSSTSNQSDSSLIVSPEPNVPLKKRLLNAYNNEQPPASSL